MLEQLAGDLERNGTQLVLARDTGSVRDVLDRAQDANATVATYPTVQAAVDALIK